MAFTTIGVLTGISIAGSLFSARGQIKAGEAAQAASEFNASVAEIQAEDALLRGKIAEERYRQGVQLLIGSQRVGFAAQNVDVGVGSAVDVAADTAFIGELDALTIRNNAAREAWGYRQNATSFRLGGQASVDAARFGAANTLLGAGTSLLQQRLQFG